MALRVGGVRAVGEKSARAIAFSFVEPRTAVLVHTRDTPGDDEWRTYLAALKARLDQQGKSVVSLVVTEGGGPNTVQRTDMNEALLKDGGSFSTAVVTESRVARGIVTAMSWFNSGIRAFAPKQLDDAIGYLGLDPREHAEVLETLGRLRAELDLGPLPGTPGLA